MNLLALLVTVIAALTGAPGRSAAGSEPASAPSGALEACVGDVGAAATGPGFEDVIPILRRHGVQLAEAVAPPDDDYWLAVDLDDADTAEALARELAPVYAAGMFGPLEVSRRGRSVAVQPPVGGPMDEVYEGAADIERLRACTAGFDIVPAG